MTKKSDKTADAEFKEAEKVVLNEKSKKEKSKKMKAKHIIETTKTVLLTLFIVAGVAFGAYLYGHSVGYNDRSHETEQINAAAAQLVEQLKESSK